jgi:hypothetical protein
MRKSPFSNCLLRGGAYGWANRRQVIPQELIGRIAPRRLEGINLRGVFRCPIERYADQLLPVTNWSENKRRRLKSTTQRRHQTHIEEPTEKPVRSTTCQSDPAPLLASRTVTYCTENEWTPTLKTDGTGDA